MPVLKRSFGNESALGRDRYLPAERASAPFLDVTPQTCAAPGCSAWARPWRSRRRPVFEGAWGCSSRCTLALVCAAVRREVGDGSGEVSSVAHRHRVPLGLVLLAQGWITHPQLRSALGAQRAAGRGRIGDWLVHGCGLSEDRVTSGLGAQWGTPVLSLDGFSAVSMAPVMPPQFIDEFGMLPLRLAGSSLLYLAFADGADASVALALEAISGRQVETGILSSSDFENAREKLFAAPSVSVKSLSVVDADQLGRAITKVLDSRQPLASRFVRVHRRFWLRIWLESAAAATAGGIQDVEDYLFTIGT